MHKHSCSGNYTGDYEQLLHARQCVHVRHTAQVITRLCIAYLRSFLPVPFIPPTGTSKKCIIQC